MFEGVDAADGYCGAGGEAFAGEEAEEGGFAGAVCWRDMLDMDWVRLWFWGWNGVGRDCFVYRQLGGFDSGVGGRD